MTVDLKSSATISKFAQAQLAAEALVMQIASDANGQVSGVVSGDTLKRLLVAGNGRVSKFTDSAAQEFASQWELVEQKASTSTGFSGTLFKYIGPDDPASGLKTNQYVMSFRSTEFIDDYARDNAATNTLEVKAGGFAYGQIADMEDWWKSLKASYPDMGTVSVTGYSLGGNLATSFALLRKAEGAANLVAVKEVYTINGAGVGDIQGASAAVETGATLTTVIKKFDDYQKGIGIEAAFTDPTVKRLYKEMQAWYLGDPIIPHPVSESIFF